MQIETLTISELIIKIFDSCEDEFGIPPNITLIEDNIIIVDFKDQGKFSILIKNIDQLN